ncbi:protein kinase domain-containing protein [Streptomyces sp. NRRL S-813]|uniref:protein kinase domain-containing protein n=1 Tax=Streptomyces sp. NRRL S-813 TaxID=1463919 RepID=UPI00068D90E3|nr:FHA domain-containing serine/threonine-protein kinase [Streptomyces sp. NRRL S-813]
MGEAVRLEVAGTIVPARTFVFSGPAAFVVGRAENCDLRAPGDDRRVSRRHCAFDIDPPTVRVRDLGSRNGTYVNGVRIPSSASRPYELADGDEVRLGGVVVRVSSAGPGHRPAGGARPAGDRIGGYVSVRELGRGAQGVVHLARHERSGELFALKVLRPEAAIRPDMVNGFLREIRTTRTLSHPHLVRFHEAGSTGTRFFLACEYCDGGSLARRVTEQDGPLGVEEAVAVTLQVLDGLAYLHGHRAADAAGTGTEATLPDRLVHRDIKPQNILLSGPCASPLVKIADFGLAKAFERAGLSGHTLTGALGGSVAFMPRSQIVNYKYAEPPVDVWAAAACLYWMLTRATPRDFPDGVDPVSVALREPVVPILRRTGALPARLATLIDGILADEDPRAHVAPSAQELGRALREAM